MEGEREDSPAMESDTEIDQQFTGVQTPTSTEDNIQLGRESAELHISTSDASWVDDPDMSMGADDSRSVFSERSKRTPSQKSSARLSRRGLSDLEREAGEMRNILITQYGMDPADDVTCVVSESESDSEGADDEVDYDTDLDMDMDEWLNADQNRLKHDETGEHRYTSACDVMRVIPATYFIKHITDQQVAMKFHGLGSEGTRAMCVPLKTNHKIEKLDLEGNWMEGTGCGCVADMLRENISISELILSENKIGTGGALSLCEILLKNDTISKLDLSGNDIKNDAAEGICDMLKKNTTLRHLYLSHNHFEEEAAVHFKEALSHNEALETLDLSWNMFRTRGTIHIAEGIQENYGLRTLNFSMNGLALTGAEAMGKALKVNRTLVDLDISFNRIPEEGAGYIAVGLQVNDVLQTLKISSNPIGTDGSHALLIALDRNDCSSLKYLELLNVWVSDDFLELKSDLERDRALVIVYGGLNKKLIRLSNLKGEDWERWLASNPMTKIKQYIRQTGYRLIDLFREFDKDGNNSISKQEFRLGIQSAGILMTSEQVDDLVKILDKDGNGEVDYAEFIAGDKLYRQAVRAARRNIDSGLTPDGDSLTDSGSETPTVLKMLNAERNSEKTSVSASLGLASSSEGSIKSDRSDKSNAS